MSNSQENSALQTELARLAQSQVQSAQPPGLALDYSEASLARLDEALTRSHPDGNVPEDVLLSCGAYVGETVRRLLGGLWAQDERGVAVLQRIGGLELSASPFSWVQRRAGGVENSIAHQFGLLKAQVGQVGVRLSSAAPAEEGEELTDEEWELLVRSPLLVFMAVAVADGKVDVKATFTRPGTYTLRAFAADGLLRTPADVVVTVEPGS